MYDYLITNFTGGTYMNVTNLKENHQLLLSYMAEKGYKEATISCYRRQIQWIIDNAENRAWTSYKDIYLEYASYGFLITGCAGKKPCSALWKGLTCTVNIQTENTISHFSQKRHTTFFFLILKG